MKFFHECQKVAAIQHASAGGQALWWAGDYHRPYVRLFDQNRDRLIATAAQIGVGEPEWHIDSENWDRQSIKLYGLPLITGLFYCLNDLQAEGTQSDA